jgi:hypothetical protein
MLPGIFVNREPIQIERCIHRMMTIHRSFIYFLLVCVLLTGCERFEKPAAASLQTPSAIPSPGNPVADCPVTQPEWVKPPDDRAVMNPPEFGDYIVNADRSIWASAWWFEDEAYPLRAGKECNKIGWFRPAGAELEITGWRLDAQASPLKTYIPSGYPTRFQATGLYFPTPGCWEVTASAADSLITYVVEVEP